MASKRTADNDFAKTCFLKCTPCFRKDESNSVQAIKFCEDCLEYLCSGCELAHNSFGLMQGHTLLNSDEMRSFHSMPCKVHPRNMIDRYCGFHAVVFCPDCKPMYHRSCKYISYLPTAAKRTKTSVDYINLMSSMKNIKLNLKQSEKTMVKELERLQRDKYATVCEIQRFTNKMIKHLEDLEKAILDELHSKYRTYEDKINDNIDDAGKSITSVEEIIKEIETHDGDTEEELLLYMDYFKVSEENYRKKIKSIQEIRKKFIKFKVNKNANKTILSYKSLGQLIEEEDMHLKYTVNFHDCYSLTLGGEKQLSSISGLCQLDDGTIVVADEKNKILKRLDRWYKVQDHCALPDSPWVMCAVGNNEVAVLLDKNKVQFVTINETMTLSRSVSVEKSCRGIGYMMDQLFVSCGDEVRVYNKSNTLSKIIKKDAFGQTMFDIPNRIAVSKNNTMIYVVDGLRGVVSVDVHDQSHSVYHCPLLTGIIRICEGPDDQLFVCDPISNNILYIGSNGIKDKILLNKKDGIENPQCLCYDKINSRLIVGTGSYGDSFYSEIRVYNLLTH